MEDETESKVAAYNKEVDEAWKLHLNGLEGIILVTHEGFDFYLGEQIMDKGGITVYDLTPRYALCGDDLEMDQLSLIIIGNRKAILTKYWGEDGEQSNDVVWTKEIDQFIVRPASEIDVDQADKMADWFRDSFKTKADKILEKYIPPNS